MKKKIIIKYKKKKINLIADDCNFLKKIIGLMFSHKQNAKILLFDFKNKQKIIIHSFFVFYPFIALWLDNKNNVLDLKIVEPFNPFVFSDKLSSKLVEIPINKINKNIVKTLISRR